MKATVTQITKASAPGHYKTTAIDAQKQAAEVRLIQVCPKVVDSRHPLGGRGVKPIGSAGMYVVTDKAWNRIQSKYSTACDF